MYTSSWVQTQVCARCTHTHTHTRAMYWLIQVRGGAPQIYNVWRRERSWVCFWRNAVKTLLFTSDQSHLLQPFNQHVKTIPQTASKHGSNNPDIDWSSVLMICHSAGLMRSVKGSRVLMICLSAGMMMSVNWSWVLTISVSVGMKIAVDQLWLRFPHLAAWRRLLWS